MDVTDVSGATEAKRPGRPPKPDKKVSLNVRLVPGRRRRLVEAAEEDGVSLTDITTTLIDEGLDRREQGVPPASQEQQIMGQHNPVDVFGLDFGRKPFAFSLLIARLVKKVLYDFYREDKNVERTWLDDPRAFARVNDAIGTLLQLIGPGERPGLFAKVKRNMENANVRAGLTAGQVAAVDLAANLAFASRDDLDERWGAVIADWLGEGVVDRLSRRLNAESSSEDASAGETQSPAE